MRHRKRGRKLGRKTAHRKALKCNLLKSLVEHGKIVTTLPKAKEYTPYADKLISIAKKADAKIKKMTEKVTAAAEGNLSDDDKKLIEQQSSAIRVDHFRRAFKILRDQKLVQKLFNEIAPLFAERNGGYTRVLRLDKNRLGDNAPQAIMMFVETKEA